MKVNGECVKDVRSSELNLESLLFSNSVLEVEFNLSLGCRISISIQESKIQMNEVKFKEKYF